MNSAPPNTIGTAWGINHEGTKAPSKVEKQNLVIS
jgi:hypothetical protein